jgi:hypothetical protein
MKPDFVLRLLAAGLCFFALASAGCAKRVPLEGGKFEAQQNVLLTMADGSTVKGRIAPGQTVEYRHGGNVYESRVNSVTEDAIRLTDLNLIDRSGSYEPTAARLADARLKIGPPDEDVNLSRTEISKVELIRFDTGKAVRRTAFWTYGGAVLLALLGERS